MEMVNKVGTFISLLYNTCYKPKCQISLKLTTVAKSDSLAKSR